MLQQRVFLCFLFIYGYWGRFQIMQILLHIILILLDGEPE